MNEHYECECGQRIPCDSVDAEDARCPSCGRYLFMEELETDIDESDTGKAFDKKVLKVRRSDVLFRRFILTMAILAVAAILWIVSAHHLVWVGEGKILPLAIGKEKLSFDNTFFTLSEINGRVAEDPANTRQYPEVLIEELRKAGLLIPPSTSRPAE